MVEPKQKSKKTLWFIAGAVAAVALLYFTFRPRSVSVEMVTAHRGTFDLTISSDGVIRSKERFVVPAFADGDIKRVEWKVGDVIRQGQSVVDLNWDVHYQPVKSPITGVISRVFRESAGPIRRGDPIVEVVDPKNLEMMVELLTSDATRVRVGNSFTISNWGGNAEIHGKVIRISKAGFTKISALGVEEEKTEVTGELDSLDQKEIEKLGNFFHVDVSILLGRQENVLLIPAGAIFRVGKEWAVYQVVDDRAHELAIEIAGRNNEVAWVSQGLREGDRVVNFPGDLVKDGARVKALTSK